MNQTFIGINLSSWLKVYYVSTLS